MLNVGCVYQKLFKSLLEAAREKRGSLWILIVFLKIGSKLAEERKTQPYHVMVLCRCMHKTSGQIGPVCEVQVNAMPWTSTN